MEVCEQQTGRQVLRQEGPTTYPEAWKKQPLHNQKWSSRSYVYIPLFVSAIWSAIAAIINKRLRVHLYALSSAVIATLSVHVAACTLTAMWTPSSVISQALNLAAFASLLFAIVSSEIDEEQNDITTIGSAMKREFASRVKISKSSEVSCRKEVSYARENRNYSSPSHASKWCNSERIFQDSLWEYDEPRHPRERSPSRSFSQRNRLEDMDSRIRMKPDEYYEPNYSKRFQEEYCGYGRGSKHDGSRDDQRGKNNRYEVLHPEVHLENNDNMRCLHYDDDISAHNLRQKSSGFQPQRSPRSFDRSIDFQNVDSPQRIKGGMVPFIHGRDAKSNMDLKPFNVRDACDDIIFQRRPS
ncbi:hypothetical protein KSP39_PZI004244 [Platanthera zijinensis]|uniref:Uncharacterized protein n=1 Tax=Platanthera zijinensis TaxID=2320716 RepID=A0AAP0BWQ6_9ASPA